MERIQIVLTLQQAITVTLSNAPNVSVVNNQIYLFLILSCLESLLFIRVASCTVFHRIVQHLDYFIRPALPVSFNMFSHMQNGNLNEKRHKTNLLFLKQIILHRTVNTVIYIPFNMLWQISLDIIISLIYWVYIVK